MSCLKKTDVINVDVMSENTDVINVDVMSEKHYFVTNVTGCVFSDNTSTFLISVFFRYDIYIDGITVFHMTSTFISILFSSQGQKDQLWYCHHILYNCKNVFELKVNYKGTQLLLRFNFF
jgi:hypothetical protein